MLDSPLGTTLGTRASRPRRGRDALVPMYRIQDKEH